LRKITKARAPSAKRVATSRHRSLALRPFAFDVVTLDQDGRETERRRGRAQQFAERLGKRTILQMVQIPGGTFTMGAPAGETGSNDSERPQRLVTVPPFYLGKYPVTIDQWRAVMGALPPATKALNKEFMASGRQPVVRVSYDEAEAFCAQLSRTAWRAYRLPTEAEWEYACRAGTASPFAFGESITREVVNHDGETLRLAGKRCATTPAGSLGVANGFGLFDMHGNVWEWCRDWWHGNYQGAPGDGSAWRRDADKRTRVLRGGSWSAAAKSCRAAARRFGELRVLKQRDHATQQAKRFKRLAWTFAKRAVSRPKKSTDPNRPRARRRRHRRRDRQHG
jgi:formylglycine-generating enzyme required for sulfatase activity